MANVTPAFAIISTYAMLCPSTDAIMGEGSHVVDRKATKAEAEALADEWNKFADGEADFHVEMRPFKEGEDQIQTPLYTAPELAADAAAFQRDMGAPAWAL